MLAATGFLRMAADGTGTANTPLVANQVVADTIKIVSTSLLGLSVGCAQCHDHRYDPILQDDYYRLRAVFEPALNPKNWRVPSQRRVSLYTQADHAKLAAIAKEANAANQIVAEKERRYLAEALDKELTKYPPELAKELRVAYETPDAKRTKAQKDLLSQHPSVNISPGLLSPIHCGRGRGFDQGAGESRRHSVPRAGRRFPPRAEREPRRTSADLSVLPR